MRAWVSSLGLVAALAACRSEPEVPKGSLGRHAGAVLSVPPDALWVATKRTLAGWGTPRFDEASHTATAVRAGSAVTVRVDPKDAAGQRSILRVVAERDGRVDTETVDRVQLEIQRSLQR